MIPSNINPILGYKMLREITTHNDKLLTLQDNISELEINTVKRIADSIIKEFTTMEHMSLMTIKDTFFKDNDLYMTILSLESEVTLSLSQLCLQEYSYSLDSDYTCTVNNIDFKNYIEISHSLEYLKNNYKRYELYYTTFLKQDIIQNNKEKVDLAI